MNFVGFLGRLHGFHWFYVESKTVFSEMCFNANPRAKPTPLAMLLLKPLLKGWENPARHRLWVDLY